ncbi:MAG TPA: DUF3313 domain-containing protein [Burkholderiales bacterium]|nr:DUF3313 domain-containing protein [Burkholderiales bacterium]
MDGGLHRALPLLRRLRDDASPRYRGVILEPVAVRYHPGAARDAVSPEEIGKLTDTFRSAVVKALGNDYRVTDSPAADVLRVRCAITDVIPVRPTLNVVTSLAVFVNADIGGAAIEVEFLDSETGERLAAGVDQKRGGRIDGVAGFTRLGQAQRALRDWATELRTALETNP